MCFSGVSCSGTDSGASPVREQEESEPPPKQLISRYQVPTSIDRELAVLGHLFTLIPRQLPEEMVRESLYGGGSGLPHLAPLTYRREGDRTFVSASKGGSDTHPDWSYNIKANPSVTTEIGSDTATYTAVEIVGDERDEIYDRQATSLGNFAVHQAGTDRVIPAIERVAE